MNTLVVVWLLLGYVVLSHATYGKQKYSGKQEVFCYDYMGLPIRPGRSYFDGCNTCICGPYGRPTICTLIYCGYNNMNRGGPISSVRPVNPTYQTNALNPLFQVNPVEPVYPAKPIKQYPRRRY
ncbi:uncharacterized protein LOC128548799 [Mercenaria mercenaria]|uniref:uncharacterized protein LOC128548799 n=1 Tax=Mercenaria mercenaria TaxID=6596 RepID=UPI00234F9693|nr:uncharacterized protein LOC128548799 [Mercenaria mercenaria]